MRPEILARAAAVADACSSGLVWREAFSGDHVCVAPAFRDQVRSDNAHAAERVNPRGAYGPNTCVNGYVWREARASDYVCVVPGIRTQVKQQNAAAGR